jgi:hypothetical protein
MESPNPGRPRTRLHVVAPARAVDRARLSRALPVVVGSHPDGLRPSDLVPELVRHLGVTVDDIDDGDLDAALGTLVVTGRIDEAHGRLVAAEQSTRATG